MYVTHRGQLMGNQVNQLFLQPDICEKMLFYYLSNVLPALEGLFSVFYEISLLDKHNFIF